MNFPGWSVCSTSPYPRSSPAAPQRHTVSPAVLWIIGMVDIVVVVVVAAGGGEEVSAFWGASCVCVSMKFLADDLYPALQRGAGS